MENEKVYVSIEALKEEFTEMANHNTLLTEKSLQESLLSQILGTILKVAKKDSMTPSVMVKKLELPIAYTNSKGKKCILDLHNIEN